MTSEVDGEKASDCFQSGGLYRRVKLQVLSELQGNASQSAEDGTASMEGAFLGHARWASPLLVSGGLLYPLEDLCQVETAYPAGTPDILVAGIGFCHTHDDRVT